MYRGRKYPRTRIDVWKLLSFPFVFFSRPPSGKRESTWINDAGNWAWATWIRSRTIEDTGAMTVYRHSFWRILQLYSSHRIDFIFLREQESDRAELCKEIYEGSFLFYEPSSIYSLFEKSCIFDLGRIRRNFSSLFGFLISSFRWMEFLNLIIRKFGNSYMWKYEFRCLKMREREFVALE